MQASVDFHQMIAAMKDQLVKKDRLFSQQKLILAASQKALASRKKGERAGQSCTHLCLCELYISHLLLNDLPDTHTSFFLLRISHA